MLITVTKDDVERGVYACIGHCALARAIRRATGYALVRVLGDNTVDLGTGTDPTGFVKVTLPPAAATWRAHFDKGRAGRAAIEALGLPFEFELSMPKGRGLFD